VELLQHKQVKVELQVQYDQDTELLKPEAKKWQKVSKLGIFEKSSFNSP
jgi:hypothetical protein